MTHQRRSLHQGAGKKPFLAHLCLHLVACKPGQDHCCRLLVETSHQILHLKKHEWDAVLEPWFLTLGALARTEPSGSAQGL